MAQNPFTIDPDGPWTTGQEPAELRVDPAITGLPNSQNPYSSIFDDRPDLESESQTMDAAVLATLHNLIFVRNPENPGNDYYAVVGLMRHGVRHGLDLRGREPLAGYLAREMSLELEVTTPDGVLYDSGPGSTVGQETTSYSIGENLNAFLGPAGGAGAGLNATISNSFSTPDVTVESSAQSTSVLWTIKLYQDQAHAPSYTGYEWNFGAVFQVPVDAQFEVKVSPKIVWSFSYAPNFGRPGALATEITEDLREWSPEQTFQYTTPPRPEGGAS